MCRYADVLHIHDSLVILMAYQHRFDCITKIELLVIVKQLTYRTRVNCSHGKCIHVLLFNSEQIEKFTMSDGFMNAEESRLFAKFVCTLPKLQWLDLKNFRLLGSFFSVMRELAPESKGMQMILFILGHKNYDI